MGTNVTSVPRGLSHCLSRQSLKWGVLGSLHRASGNSLTAAGCQEGRRAPVGGTGSRKRQRVPEKGRGMDRDTAGGGGGERGLRLQNSSWPGLRGGHTPAPQQQAFHGRNDKCSGPALKQPWLAAHLSKWLSREAWPSLLGLVPKPFHRGAVLLRLMQSAPPFLSSHQNLLWRFSRT